MALAIAWLAWTSGQRILYTITAALVFLSFKSGDSIPIESIDGAAVQGYANVLSFWTGLAVTFAAAFWYLHMRAKHQGTGAPRYMAIAAIAMPLLAPPAFAAALLYSSEQNLLFAGYFPQALGAGLLAASMGTYRFKRRRVDKPDAGFVATVFLFAIVSIVLSLMTGGIWLGNAPHLATALCVMGACAWFCYTTLTSKGAESAVTANRTLRITTQNLELENRQLTEMAARLEYDRKRLSERRIELEKENAQAEKRIRELCETADAFYTLGQSIDYARRIQQALTPSEATLRGCVGESFVLNLPRDKVSGDFLWCAKFADGWAMVCVADCTGHGVPGAFMSALGSTLLGHVVNERGVKRPDQVLFALDRNLRSALASNGGDIQDGMEAAILLISPNRNQALFAGAKLKLHRALNGNCDVIEGTRRAIGGKLRANAPAFESGTISLRKGEMLYLSSDGFPDQLGGSQSRRYLSGRFKDTLGWVSGLPIAEQRSALLKSHTQWRAGMPQTDDVLLVGIKV